MRKVLNKLLRPLGYELRRIDRFQEFLADLTRGPAGLKFVQVGAHDGVSFDGLYATAISTPCAGLLIEPLPDAFARLRNLYADRPRIVPLNLAVHATATAQLLYRADATVHTESPPWVAGLASFDRGHLVRHGVPEDGICSELVPCRPLMSLLEEHGFLDANLLQVDVEGYDAEVLKMVDWKRFRPRLVKYEHKNLASGDAEAARNILKRANYELFRTAEDTIGWLRS